MNKSVILLLLVLFVIVALFLFGLSHITGLFIGFGPPAEEYEWWNVSWLYRVELRINTTSYNRIDWPAEYQINFTDLMPSGTFDENSVRVVEYDSSGQILQEQASQFDQADNYDANTNAYGTLVFMMNGSAAADTERIYFVYYGTTQQGAKEDPNYATSLVYDFDLSNGEFNVNNSILAYWGDSSRNGNSSGLIRVRGIASQGDIFDWTPPLSENDPTYEYSQLSNASHNFTFNFTNNVTLIYSGSVRMIVEMGGDEMVWNTSTMTNEGYGIKRYTFYNDIPWVRVDLTYKNVGGSSITRNSTFTGVIGIDTVRAFGETWESTWGNATEPGWWYAADPLNSFHASIIHINQSGASGNFWIPNSSQASSIGVQLNTTTINAGAYIVENVVMDFNDTSGYYPQVRDLRNRLAAPIIATLQLPEYWYMIINGSTNTTVYNRNESVLILGNISDGDPYNTTQYMNATFDMGTGGTGDDQTIQLFDDGQHGDFDPNDKVFGNVFNISNSATTGAWTANITTYSDDFVFLNNSLETFQVTDWYNLTVNIINDKPIVGEIVYGNIYVRNYMENYWIIGAIVNCSYDLTELNNISDQFNGTYSFNFTSPLSQGTYLLTCNATKNGNFGEENESFSAEAGKTNVTIAAIPTNPIVSNVRLYFNDTFIVTANATVVQNGTAYNTNVTVEVASGWVPNATTQDCGEVDKYESCLMGFNITVPNGTLPGNYSLNLTVNWTHPDNTDYSNTTEINVTVQSNPEVDVVDDDVSGDGADGSWNIVGNFTTLSAGNDGIYNISFICQSGDVCNNFGVIFVPNGIAYLAMGSSESVSINVTVPLDYIPGTYTGVINVSAINVTIGQYEFDNFTLYVTVPPSTNISITPNIPSYTAYNITQEDDETFNFYINLTNVKNSSAAWTNISLSYGIGWASNSSLETCGNLTRGEVCTHHFNVTIPDLTTPGDYYVYITANWTNNDESFGTNTSAFTVTVASNPELNITEPNVTGNASDGTNSVVGNFTVFSAGNDALQNVNFDCLLGDVCANFTLQYNPGSISTLAAGINQTVGVNATVPVGFPSGMYNGILNVSTTNGGELNLTIFVYVSENRTWNATPTICEKSQQVPTGLACNVNITNLGNSPMTFNITPDQVNYTQVNDTDFIINRSSSLSVAITYDVSGAPFGTHNSTYLIDANQSGSIPDSVSINVTIIPSTPPLMNYTILPNQTYQNATIMFRMNVTDRSGSGVPWVGVNVTRPNGTLDVLYMYQTSIDNNLTTWELTYPNSTNETNGSTYVRGTYNVTMYTHDNIGNWNYKNGTITIYSTLDVTLATLTNTYYQGDTASVYYIVRGIDGNATENVTVSFTVYDSQGNVSYLSGNMTTNSLGTITPLPSFEIPSDSPLGTYTLSSYSSYYDITAGETVEREVNHTFEVYSRTVTVTGIFADIETAVVWYPPIPGYSTPTIKFGILVYNGEGEPVDPDYINLTLYKPDDNLCFSTLVTNSDKQATGFYVYETSFICADSITPTGMYLAVVNVTQGSFNTMKLKAFRVASGGPYDVRLQLLETEAELGGALDYLIIIENKGELRQDVHVEYWYSPTGSSTRYGTWTEYVLTPPLVNESFTRYMNIPSNQVMGSYMLFAKMTYDSSQPALTVNSSFSVVSPVSPTTTQPYVGGGISPYITAEAPAPTAELQAGLIISRYNNNISLARSVTILESVTVNNTGQTDLNNVSLFLIGVPVTWYNITPDTYRSLPEGNSSVFVITIRAPKNAELTSYKANLIATSGVVSDDKEVEITIFASLEELIREEIRTVRRELQDLEVDTRVAEIEGKDTTNVELMIEEIKSQADLAETYLDDGELEDASSSIANAKNLLERARDMLDKLEVIKVRARVIPLWMIVAATIIISVIVFLYVYLKRKRVQKILRPYIVQFGKLTDSVKLRGPPKEDLTKEKQKVERMLRVLEKERKEGIISAGAYREMKKSLEKKLENVQKKLK
jgi:uncharacterized membrane protein